jgi:hypothetical protein
MPVMLFPSWLMVINTTQPAVSVTIRTIKPAQPPGMASVFVGFEQ